jgi:uncharacterized low-complexity protein
MKKITSSFAIGAALLSGVAGANPFGATELASGYMQLAATDAKATEMKCGADMKMDAPAPKTAEGACAGKKSDVKDAAAKAAADKAALDSVTAPQK